MALDEESKDYSGRLAALLHADNSKITLIKVLFHIWICALAPKSSLTPDFDPFHRS